MSFFKKDPIALQTDIEWAGATVKWDLDKEGWCLPGGGFTKNRNRALFVAKELADLIGTYRPTTIVKKAA